MEDSFFFLRNVFPARSQMSILVLSLLSMYPTRKTLFHTFFDQSEMSVEHIICVSVFHMNKTDNTTFFPGYEGPNCEVDVDECVEQPCENGGECFERSDPSHWELEWELSFVDAAGYICQCQPGFAGQ